HPDLRIDVFDSAVAVSVWWRSTPRVFLCLGNRHLNRDILVDCRGRTNAGCVPGLAGTGARERSRYRFRQGIMVSGPEIQGSGQGLIISYFYRAAWEQKLGLRCPM